MMTIDEFEEAMDQIAEELPEEFYRELNGGILILPEKRKSPYAKADDLWVLGMYVHSSSMGRLIEIYYGSFCEDEGPEPGGLDRADARDVVP